jgi:hypothetical protein
MKQETLQEMAERLYPVFKRNTLLGSKYPRTLQMEREAFIIETEHQAEKMYSEQEVEKICKELFFTIANCEKNVIHKESDFEKWFDQHKKK